MFAYEQCLLCLGHHPDIWYEAASHLEHASKVLSEKGVSLIFCFEWNILRQLIFVNTLLSCSLPQNSVSINRFS